VIANVVTAAALEAAYRFWVWGPWSVGLADGCTVSAFDSYIVDRSY